MVSSFGVDTLKSILAHDSGHFFRVFNRFSRGGPHLGDIPKRTLYLSRDIQPKSGSGLCGESRHSRLQGLWKFRDCSANRGGLVLKLRDNRRRMVTEQIDQKLIRVARIDIPLQQRRCGKISEIRSHDDLSACLYGDCGHVPVFRIVRQSRRSASRNPLLELPESGVQFGRSSGLFSVGPSFGGAPDSASLPPESGPTTSECIAAASRRGAGAYRATMPGRERRRPALRQDRRSRPGDQNSS